MKRTIGILKGLTLGGILLGISLCQFALPGDVLAVNMTFVSDAADPGWNVIDAKGTSLKSPQNVCLNETSPPNCPTGAMKYGHVSPGVWPDDLSSIPGAKWIWAPKITGASSPAANEEFTFEHQFYLCGVPNPGKISVAVDDSAEVFLNDIPTPVLTSTSNLVKTKTIPASYINQGLNTIKVKARNAYLDWCKNTDNYQCNPAGMVFGASFSDSLSALPTCIGDDGKIYRMGETEKRPPCDERICGCIGLGDLVKAYWSPWAYKCQPVTCTDKGQVFQVGQVEPLSCPGSKQGTASRTCQPDGTWGKPDYSKCTEPVTCTDDGQFFQVGQVEQLSCPSPKQGTASRTCQPDGTWGKPDYSKCTLPRVNQGDKCAETHQGYRELGICPNGTECGSRRTCWEECTLWIFCHQECLVSTDWYCDPK